MSRTKQSARKHGSKRKRDPATEGDEPEAKKPALNSDVPARPEQTTYDESISMMDPSLLADHFAKATKKYSKDESTIELEEKYLPAKAFKNTTSFGEPHVAKHLSTYLEQFTDGGKDTLTSCQEISSPHTLVVSPSGIRAADLTRELRVFSGDENKIAKLFAKHMKLKEAVKFVEKAKFGIAVGTPSRLQELMVQDAVKLDHLQRIVIDGSYVDEKKRTVFDMKELFLPLVGLLNLEKVRSRYGVTDGITIMVF